MRVEKSNFTVKRMARLLDVSRSGFYAWLKRKPAERTVRRERIEKKVIWFHSESDEVSGAPKILADLREDREIISRKTVAKVMRQLGLRGICPTRWRTTTVLDGADRYPADAVKREWDTGAEPGLGRRDHLSADVGRMALSRDRDRRAFASGDRLGNR